MWILVKIGKADWSMLEWLLLYILKTKSNFTLLLYIPFLGIGELYFKYVQFIQGVHGQGKSQGKRIFSRSVNCQGILKLVREI